AQHFGDGLAYVAQIGAAAALAGIRRPVNDITAREACRKIATLLPLAFRLLGRWRPRVCGFRFRLSRLRRDRLGFGRLGFLKRQFELFDHTIDPLGTRTEFLAPKLRDLRLQLLDRQLRDDEAVLAAVSSIVFAESSTSFAVSSASLATT